MSRSLTVENETHWRTKDVKHLVRAAMKATGYVLAEPHVLRICYARDGKGWARLCGRESIIINIELPKRGTKHPHPNALVALAAAGLASNTDLLPFQDVYRIANTLAHLFAANSDDATVRTTFNHYYGSIALTSVTSGLFVAKYADPTKDAAFVAFTSKIEAKIAAAQSRVDKWQAEKDRADKNLKRALRDRKAAERSLKDAKRRRGL